MVVAVAPLGCAVLPPLGAAPDPVTFAGFCCQLRISGGQLTLPRVDGLPPELVSRPLGEAGADAPPAPPDAAAPEGAPEAPETAPEAPADAAAPEPETPEPEAALAPEAPLAPEEPLAPDALAPAPEVPLAPEAAPLAPAAAAAPPLPLPVGRPSALGTVSSTLPYGLCSDAPRPTHRVELRARARHRVEHLLQLRLGRGRDTVRAGDAVDAGGELGEG